MPSEYQKRDSYPIPREHDKLFQGLLAEIGDTEGITFEQVSLEDSRHNPDLVDPEMATRGFLRIAVLDKLGLGREELEKSTTSPSESFEEIRTLIDPPLHKAYEWQQVDVFDLGNFEDLKGQRVEKILLIPEKRVVLFSDEVENLSSGEKVTTLHAAGYSQGFLAEFKDQFLVTNDNLYRIFAYFSN
jgi:hypothetical protein